MFPESPPPRRIGDFEIVRKLRDEGSVEVYLARDKGPLGFARDVTLKCVRDAESDATRAAELAREARICSRLNHASIVRVLGLLSEGGRVALALEHETGTTLATLLAELEARGEKLDDVVASHIASTVAEAVGYAHGLLDELGKATPVLHRAISPSVVLLARDGTVKLSGFGLAKILDRSADSAIGVVKGVAGFLAPEQVRGEPATEKSDVWALGMLCHRLFTTGLADRSVLGVISGRPPSLGSLRGGLSKEVVAAIDAALHESPGARTIRAAELARWIERALPPQSGRSALRALIDTLPQQGEEIAGRLTPRTSRRRVRGMERRASSSKGVLRAATELSTGAATEGSTEAATGATEPEEEDLDEISVDPMSEPAIEAPLPKPVTSMPGPRIATMLGVGPSAPSPVLRTFTPAEPRAPAESGKVEVKNAQPPLPVVITPPTAPAKPATPLPAPAPIAIEATPLTAEDDFARPRRSSWWIPTVILSVGALIALAILVVRARPKATPETAASAPSPTNAVSTSAVKATTAHPPAHPAKPKDAGPTASSSAASGAASASSAASAAASPTKPVAKPMQKPPKGMGWLHVHSALPGKVYVGGKARGEPGQTVAVPCGKIYVNLAKVDGAGNWKGWVAKGVNATVACDGSVSEVTLEK